MSGSGGAVMKAKVMIDREDGVLRVVMNRPEKKNALDREMYETITAALRSANADADTRAILLGATGGAFCAGNDLDDFRYAVKSPRDFAAFPFVKALVACRKPLVAAVDGDAVGLGATMLLHCDLVYAAPSARFRMPFVDLGFTPEAGSSLLAPMRFGLAKASQFLLLCESFDAEEAARLGLVNALVAAPALQATALDAARRLAEKFPSALLETRRLLRGDQAALERRIDEEAQLFAKALGSPEVRARVEAFFEAKRETR